VLSAFTWEATYPGTRSGPPPPAVRSPIRDGGGRSLTLPGEAGADGHVAWFWARPNWGRSAVGGRCLRPPARASLVVGRARCVRGLGSGVSGLLSSDQVA
jgi:hypothetical protein